MTEQRWSLVRLVLTVLCAPVGLLAAYVTDPATTIGVELGRLYSATGTLDRMILAALGIGWLGLLFVLLVLGDRVADRLVAGAAPGRETQAAQLAVTSGLVTAVAVSAAVFTLEIGLLLYVTAEVSGATHGTGGAGPWARGLLGAAAVGAVVMAVASTVRMAAAHRRPR